MFVKNVVQINILLNLVFSRKNTTALELFVNEYKFKLSALMSIIKSALEQEVKLQNSCKHETPALSVAGKGRY